MTPGAGRHRGELPRSRAVDGWLRYHHESTYVGAGMSYVRGQVLTEEGCLVASFTQDPMIRAFAPNGSATPVPLEARL